jgi:hypothetical protein
VESYSVRALVSAEYDDGTEKALTSKMDLRFYDPGKQPDMSILRLGATGLESLRMTIHDPVMRSSVEEGLVRPRYLPSRQPGLWILLNKALEYLAGAVVIREVHDTEGWAPGVVHYRAAFQDRPDLALYRTGEWSIHSDLMLRTYEDATADVDVWIDADDLVRQIEVVTRGMAYPGDMAEPNDLLGVVEERATLTFTLFKFHGLQ